MTPLDRIRKPKDGFSVIYADPPWKFEAWSPRGEKKSPSQHYSLMPLDELVALPVQAITADNAVLFLWVVQTHLPEAHALMTCWGFKLRTVAFAWVKMSPKWLNSGFLPPTTRARMSLGYHTRSGFEQCWLGIRGKGYKRIRKNVEQVLYAPVREHSRKPDEFYERIEALTGDVPKIELFAQQRRKGWTAWGKEVGKYG